MTEWINILSRFVCSLIALVILPSSDHRRWRWLLNRAAQRGIAVHLVERCRSGALTDGSYFLDERVIEISANIMPLDPFIMAHELAHAELGHEPGTCIAEQEDEANAHARQLLRRADEDNSSWPLWGRCND